MTSLYRYISEQWVEPFTHRGDLLFRPLSYYMDYEDDQTRGDEFEGTRVFQPDEGLRISNLSSGKLFDLPLAHQSTADEDNIFVYCLSTEFSKELADRFRTSVCIEIQEPEKFISKVRAAIPPLHKIQSKHLAHGPVNYYPRQEPPIVDWAFPDRIALSKLEAFSWQHEYRLAFAVKDAFDLEKVAVKLVPPGSRPKPRSGIPAGRKVQVGSLLKLCKVHRLA